MRKILLFIPLFFSIFISSVFAADLFFQGPSDLSFKIEELPVGKKIPCELSVHYQGKDPVMPLVKIYRDGVNITSFPLVFEKTGTEIINFSFRVETEGKHHLEFVIVASGEFKDTQAENNRFSVSFHVPGDLPKFSSLRAPERREAIPAGSPRRPNGLLATTEAQELTPKKKIKTDPKNQIEKRERLKKKLSAVKKDLEGQLVIQKQQVAKDNEQEISSIEEGYQDFDQPDALAYLDQDESSFDEEAPLVDISRVSGKDGKPILDIYFPSAEAFQMKSVKNRNKKTVNWLLLIQSSGVGEGEVEVVVADGNKKLISQKIWIRGGEVVQIPMQAIFERPGPHRLTAMVNTQNNVIDRNMENNITEQTINVA